MSGPVVGVDFGLSVTDAVLVEGGAVVAHAALSRPGAASRAVLERALDALGAAAGAAPHALGVTGGRSATLEAAHGAASLVHVPEPEAIGRGGLELAGATRALVVSCGTGTAMVAADAAADRFAHYSGTAVGGGTLEGLAAHLLGVRDAEAVMGLAARGDAAGVDTTLGEVLGGGVGALPAHATAVNLGRLADLAAPAAEDLAAGLVTMVAQTVALVAVNAARAAGLERTVVVGRLAGFAAVRRVIESVFALYGAPAPRFPPGGEHATALGAALAAGRLARDAVAGGR